MTPVLTIRDAQMRALEAQRVKSFTRGMIAHLRTHFPGRVAGLDDERLLILIHQCFDKAKSYGFTSEMDRCRFLNLSAAYGWDFATAPGNAWMAASLDDAAVSSPSDRLHLLVHECIRRARVERHNDLLLRQFEGAQ